MSGDRKSSRQTKGKAPERYGFEEDVLTTLTIPQQNQDKGKELEDNAGKRKNEPDDSQKDDSDDTSVKCSLKADQNFQINQKAVSSRNSSRSKAFSCSSSIRRQRLELQLKAAEKLAELEEEKFESKKRLIEMRLQLEEAKIEEIVEVEAQIVEEDKPTNLESLKSFELLSDDGRVNNWLENVSSEQKDKLCKGNIEDECEIKGSCDKLVEVFTKVIENVAKHNNTGKIDHFIKRQTSNKDLPEFDGNPAQWPIFISQFENGNKVCNFSQDENLIRLQKCLRGKAKEVVQSLLISPDNVPDIIESLSLNFGRPECIVMVLIEKARRYPAPRYDNLESFLTYSNLIRNMVTTIKNLKCVQYLNNPQLIGELVAKLPAHLKMQWGSYIYKEKKKSFDLNDFAEWTKETANILSRVYIPIMNRNFYEEMYKRKNDGVGKKNETVFVTKMNKRQHTSCIFCNSVNHDITSCKLFLAEDVNNRWKRVTEAKLCFSCLQKYHSIFLCRRKKPCGIDHCRKTHHPLLHKDEEQTHGAGTSGTSVEESQGHVPNCSKERINYHQARSRSVLLRIVPVKIIGPDKEVETYALFDEASTVTLIDENLANEVGLQGFVEPLCYQWTNEIVREEAKSRRVTLKIQGSYKSAKAFEMKNVRTICNLSLPSQTVNVEELKRTCPYIQQVKHIKSYVDGQPLILIGQDNARLTIARKVLYTPEDYPIISKSLLGWVVHGNISQNFQGRVDKSLNYHLCCLENQNDLHQLIKNTYQMESFGIVSTDGKYKSKEDIKAEEIMSNTIKRVGERFEIGLIWKREDIVLPGSKDNALKRLRCVEKKMDKDIEFAKEYSQKIEDYVRKGFARRLTEEEVKEYNPKTWYLPHFAVKNPNKPGKLRFVMDAAAESSGMSLNDALLTGPDLLTSLIGILWNFRRLKVAFSGDIKEMFHQVRIRKEDRAAQRFLWRGMDRNREPDVYEMIVMIFGSVCSPSLAQFVKNRNATEWKDEFPNAYNGILKLHYVDDYLDCADSEEEASRKVLEVIEVHRRGGFEICNWLCSSKYVLAKIPEELRAKDWKNLDENHNTILERVLGIWWNPELDCFVFVQNFNKVEKDILLGKMKPTKRQVLQVVMSIFDPCGFISNFTIKGKILLQDVWRTGVDWDATITEDHYQKWKKWVYKLQDLDKLNLPRCYFKNNFSSAQLHIFCDASEKAFSTVAYLRIQIEDGFRASLITAKAKVAPLKPVSIPRLELQAALMACRLGKTIKQELNVRITSTTFWTDSKTVLCWLRGDPSKFKPFVAHRTVEILEMSSAEEWRWVPTHENVADDATRDSSFVFNFDNGSRWFEGPAFLRSSEDAWPEEDVKEKCNSEVLELKRNFVTLAFHAVEELNYNFVLPDIQRFSSLLKLLRTTAWILRFVQNCRKRSSYAGGELVPDELKKAEVIWIKYVQQESFTKEMKLLRNGKMLTRESKLLQLSPALDTDGIMRMQGRIEASETASFNTKRPIILDPKHRFTRLLIQRYHELARHQGQEFVVNELRQTYWILNMRRAVRSTWNACQFCKNRRAKPRVPEMGQLPLVRLGSSQRVRPFSYTGMDYFGPMEVTVGRHREKRYGVLFTCLSARAVHLEVAHSLTTDSCVMAIRRLIGRRGCPIEIWSDNGTNLKGAEKELKDALKTLNQNELTNECTQKKIKWTFIPPAAPHMGGCWERLVRSVKTVLKIILKERAPKDETLLTFLIEVEGIVNSRPLTHVSVDPDDEESLTPNHFLIGTSSSMQVSGVFDDNDLQCRRQWRIAQRLADHFWKRWLREFLPTLTRRTKWFGQTKPIKIGDIVIIIDGNAPRNTWLRGRVTAVYPGSDGRIRMADIQTKTGVYRRPVVKLCILEVNGDE